MKRNLLFILYLLVFFLCIPSFISCENEQESATGPINVSDIKHSSCKTFKSLVSEKQDCIEYQTVNDNYLKINRINVAFNCCIDDVDIKTTVDQERVITITETEISPACNCLCLYDLEYTIGPLEYGMYTLRIIEGYADAMTVVFRFSATTQGSYCEVREGYPWGIK
jgi:hypothetical protein